MKPDILSVVDAAYVLDLDELAWLRGIAEAARPLLDAGLGLFAVAYDASNPDRFHVDASIVEGLSARLGPVRAQHRALFDRAWVQATFLGFTCDHIRNQAFARHAAGEPALLDRLYAPYGVRDIFCVNAVDPSGLGYQLNVLQPRVCRMTPGLKMRWSRVAAHIAAGKRLRKKLATARGGAPDAVLAPSGKLLHAEEAAQSKEARAQLVESVRTRERAHGPLRRLDPDEAVTEWRGLVAARWTLVDQFESDGKRYLVARRNEPELLGLASLTARERCAVAFAALGHSNKLIAYEMGIAPSTVAVLLSRAARRLGTRSRAELVQRYVADAARNAK